SVHHTQPARPLRTGQSLRRFRVPGDVDFGSRTVGGPERRMEDSSLDSVITAREVDLPPVSPEGIAHRQELLGTSVPLIVLEAVSLGVLFWSGPAGDEIQGTPPPCQEGERIELLHECGRLHPPRGEGGDELEPPGPARERARREQWVRLV